jgi:Replication initiator protein A
MEDAQVVKDEPLVGRDEMNLAEFPITLLTDKPSKAVKTLTFEDQHGKLTITGSDDYGLPTAPDGDVIIGLIQLTKLRNNFNGRKVTLSRYELLKLPGWDDQGRHYRRPDESLRRRVGVTLRYDKF